MAGSVMGEGAHVLGGTQVTGRSMSVRRPDLTGKGKVTEGDSSSSSTASDRVAKMLGSLNLTSQEATTFVLEDEEDEYLGCPEWAIVGKVLAPNPLHITTIRSVLRPAWGNPKGLEIRPLGVNLFMAEFACKADLDRIRGGSPWTVSKHAVLFKDFDPTVRPADICFDRLSVWARILHLPFGLMNDTHGKSQ